MLEIGPAAGRTSCLGLRSPATSFPISPIFGIAVKELDAAIDYRSSLVTPAPANRNRLEIRLPYGNTFSTVPEPADRDSRQIRDAAPRQP